jgi:succinate dehydrogenase hydrophobic anchor subunit
MVKTSNQWPQKGCFWTLDSFKYKILHLYCRVTKLNKKQSQTFLFAAQGVGTVFVVIFLAAYFGGLPSTETLNSEPSFILAQTVVGLLLIVFVIAAFVLAILTKSKNKLD